MKSDREALLRFSSELEEELQENILPFWLKHIDQERGGFYGEVDHDNRAIKNADKGAILNTRLLWAFSTLGRNQYYSECRRLAHRAFHFLTDYFWDAKYGGVFWEITADGIPSDDRKHIYVQAFGIYALSEYYRTFGDKEALKYAEQLYLLIEGKSADAENGGYYEAFNRSWKPLNDVRLSQKDTNKPRSMNTHLHVLEAYTNLYRCKPTEDRYNRIEKLLDLFVHYIISDERKSLHSFLSENWVPQSDTISFGHDIEASWLLLEASNVIQSYEKDDLLRGKSRELCDGVFNRGMDEDGGIFTEGNLNGITNYDKEWWPQAEAMVGFWKMYRYFKDERYYSASQKVWDFIKNSMRDKKFGDWHCKVNQHGIPFPERKVSFWKGPYHNTRACLEIIRDLTE